MKQSSHQVTNILPLNELSQTLSEYGGLLLVCLAHSVGSSLGMSRQGAESLQLLSCAPRAPTLFVWRSLFPRFQMKADSALSWPDFTNLAA